MAGGRQNVGGDCRRRGCNIGLLDVRVERRQIPV